MKTSHYPLLACVAFLISSAAAQDALYFFESITTVKGHTYQKVEIREVTPSGIRIRHDSGTATIPFQSLPKDLQARLGGFNPKTAADHAKEEQQAIRALEHKFDAEAETLRKKQAVAAADKIAPDMKGAAHEDKDTPPPARFSTEVLAFFTAISSQYRYNGAPVKGVADPKPALTRLAGTSDPLLKEAVEVALALDANQKEQETQGRFLEAKMNGMVPGVQGTLLGQGVQAATAPWHMTGQDPRTGQPIYEQESSPLSDVAQGLEASMDGANTQAALNLMSELNIQSLALGHELREKVADIARRDLPKAQILPSPFVAEFVKPGMLAITNRSGKTLRSCLFSTTTTMYCHKDESKDQAIANVLNAFVGFSPEFRHESAKQTALRAKLASAKRGFLIYSPILRDQETLTIPFCDMPSMPDAAIVHLSAWTDEFTGENSPIAGLQELQTQLEAEAKARWERENANAARAKKPALNDGNRVNLQPKITRDPNNPLHQGNGARMFNR